MLSRLVILAVGRELSEGMEDAGVTAYLVLDWQERFCAAVLKPCPSTAATRVLEDALSKLVREAVSLLKGGLDES